MNSCVNPFGSVFKNPTLLQRLICARLELDRQQRYSTLVQFGNLTGCLMRCMTARKACIDDPDLGIASDELMRIEDEISSVVEAAVQLWPIGCGDSIAITQRSRHDLAVQRVIEVAMKYGFTDIEGYFLAHPYPVEVSVI
ncbi:MAG: hypothetical protein PVI21_01135 [Candidatus Woesebacteria bacterium]